MTCCASGIAANLEGVYLSLWRKSYAEISDQVPGTWIFASVAWLFGSSSGTARSCVEPSWRFSHESRLKLVGFLESLPDQDQTPINQGRENIPAFSLLIWLKSRVAVILVAGPKSKSKTSKIYQPNQNAIIQLRLSTLKLSLTTTLLLCVWLSETSVPYVLCKAVHDRDSLPSNEFWAWNLV